MTWNRFWLLDSGLLLLVLAFAWEYPNLPSPVALGAGSLLLVLRLALALIKKGECVGLPWVTNRENRFNLICLVLAGLTITALAILKTPQPLFHLVLLASPLFLPWGFARSQIRNQGMPSELVTWCSADAFSALRRLQLMVLHQVGVFTSHEIEVTESWFDSDPQNVPELYRVLLAQLHRLNPHPFAKAFATGLGSVGSEHLVNLQTCEGVKDMGWVIQFRDANNQSRTVRLGTLAWHRILGHEIDVEGREQLVAWKKRGLLALALSDGSQIVACFGFRCEIPEAHERAVLEMRKAGVLCGLISAAPLSEADRIQKVFDRTASLLSSLERRCVLEKWYERFPRNLEIISDWDEAPNRAALKGKLFTQSENASTDLLLKNLEGVQRIYRASRSLHFHSYLMGGVLSLSLLTILSSAQLWFLLPALTYFGALTLAPRS